MICIRCKANEPTKGRLCDNCKLLCVDCGNLKTTKGSYCTPCRNVKTIAWKIANPQRTKEIADKHYKKYRENNKNLLTKRKNEKRRRWRDEGDLRWEKYRIKQAIRKSIKKRKLRQATPKWANIQKMVSIYQKCIQITKETGIEHHVDHIVPLNGKEVSGLNVENNLQILTREENIKKSNKFLEAYKNC